MNEWSEETITRPDTVKKDQKKLKKILVVGSWAKEQITIENIKRNPTYRVFAYMDTKNPGIISLVDGYTIGDLHNINDIVAYAKKQNIDLVLITTAAPLSLGVVDQLEKENIRAFGPTKTAARLESDKAFSRQLMKSHGISAVPEFEVFDNVDDAVKFAEKLHWNVAVKPIGLTEGLGVRVFGDQLKNKEEVIQYIHQVFEKKIGGESKILIEQKMVGEEFTIQCLVNGTHIIATPAVQDFKKLLPHECGPNTASMGSYADTDFLLPFMKQKDYVNALEIIKKTLDAFYKETREYCKGILYGQFMITANGLVLIEYNFRPGDPEWINTLFILKDNIVDVIFDLMNGKSRSLHFDKKATVCKYIVPEGYPKKLNEILHVRFDQDKIKKMGVGIYYSSGLDGQDHLRNGCERGIAFVAKGDTIYKANGLVESAISTINGDFHYRWDIGSPELVMLKIQRAEVVRC